MVAIKLIRAARRLAGARPASVALARFGHLTLAERFIAPPDLAAIRLPLEGLGDAAAALHQGVRIVILGPDGNWRTARLGPVALEEGSAVTLGFVSFANAQAAPFGLLVFKAAGIGPEEPPPTLMPVERRAMLAAVANRPPMALPCNQDAPHHDRMRIPLLPVSALHVWQPQAEPAAQPEASGTAPREDRIAWWIDRAWRERGDSFIEGWVHAHHRHVASLTFETPLGPVTTDAMTPRPELLPHYPMLPEGAARAGFTVALPGLAADQVHVTLQTEDGPIATTLTLPAPLPDPAAAAETERRDQAWALFIDEINTRALEVMELGSRIVGPHTVGTRSMFPTAKRFVGVDIHPSPAVDIVADAHRLSLDVGPGSVDALFSIAVLEHLAMPWLAAAEINRTLRMGGLTYHVTPQAWPVHEQPNDFWRFTDEALRLLFGPANGFETLAVGMCDRIRMYPEDRDAVDVFLPFNPGYGTAFVLARKVAEVQAGLAAAPGTAFSQRYPNREHP